MHTMPFVHAVTTQPTVLPSVTYGPTPTPTVTLNSNPLPSSANNHIASEPVPIPQQHEGNPDSVVEMTITDESSASSTPVSDTTATDTDSTGVSTIPP